MTHLIAREEFVSRLIDLCLKSGMAGFPRKLRDRHILLKSVVLTLDVAMGYTENGIDDRLQFWLTDVARAIDEDRVSLRRLLVDEGYIERDRRGSVYKVRAGGPRPSMFEPEVENVDVYEAIGVGMKLIQQQKAEYSGTQSRSGDSPDSFAP